MFNPNSVQDWETLKRLRKCKVTNFEKVKAMSAEQFAEWVLFEAPAIGRQYTQSTIGLTQWLESEVTSDDSVSESED